MNSVNDGIFSAAGKRKWGCLPGCLAHLTIRHNAGSALPAPAAKSQASRASAYQLTARHCRRRAGEYRQAPVGRIAVAGAVHASSWMDHCQPRRAGTGFNARKQAATRIKTPSSRRARDQWRLGAAQQPSVVLGEGTLRADGGDDVGSNGGCVATIPSAAADHVTTFGQPGACLMSPIMEAPVQRVIAVAQHRLSGISVRPGRWVYNKV